MTVQMEVPERLGGVVSAPMVLIAARVLCTAAIAVAGAPASPLAAQDSLPLRDSATVLPPLEATASILPLAYPDPSSGIPARSFAVDMDSLAGAGTLRRTPDVLSGRSAMSVYDDLGSPHKITLSSRGFFSSPVVGLPQGISVFLDGIPVNEPDAAQVNFDLLPLAHVRRIELLGGTASLLGPNSLGGAINLMTRRGEGPLSGTVEFGAGSYGAASAEGSFDGSSGGWQFYGGGGYGTEDGWRALTGADSWSGFLNVGRGDQRSGFNLQLLRADSRAETAGSLPLSVYAVRPDSNLSAGDFEDLEQWHAAVSAYAPAATGRVTASLYLRLHDAERFNVNQINDPDVRSFSENRTIGAAASWNTGRSAGSGVLGVRVGAGGSLNDVRIRLLAERLNPGLTTDVESDIVDANLYGTAEYSVGRIRGSAAVRWDYVRVPYRNLLDRSKDTTSTYARLSPSVGLTISAKRGLDVYASAGRSFRAPAVIELACADPEEPCPLPFALGDDPPLDPVIATTLEAGVRLEAGRLALDASTYRTWVEDDIFLFPYQDESEPEGSTIDGYFGNLGATRRQGLEVAASYAASSAVAMHVSYAWTVASFEVDGAEIFSIREAAGAENEVERGDRFPLIPAHRVTAGARARLPGGFTLSGTGRYVGEQYLRGDEANDETPLDAYFTADAGVRWSRGSWTVLALVTNILGSDHATFGTFNINQSNDQVERFLTPAQPRQLRVSVGRTFGG